MFKTAALSIFFLVAAPGIVFGQWTCDTAIPASLPFEQNPLETQGPDSWGYWHRFMLDRPAVVEITGGAPYPPGWGRSELWSDCVSDVPDGLIGGYESPDFDTAAPFDSGEVPLAAGTYYVLTRIFYVLAGSPGTLFDGKLRIDVRYPLEVRVLSTVNPKSRGVIPVAVLGSASFDVSDIDVSTLWFGPGQAPARHDLADAWTYNEHLQDVNLDGYVDLVTHFRTQDAGIACSDESAALGADLLDGSPVDGSDAIKTSGC